MSEPRSPRDWQTLFAAAMVEGDSTQVRLRIERAEEAIQARLRKLPETFSVGSEQSGFAVGSPAPTPFESSLTSG